MRTNSSEMNEDEGQVGLSTPEYIEMTYLVLITIISVLGNVFVCLCVMTFKNLQTIPNILVCSLAISDILMATLDMTTNATTVMFKSWEPTIGFCYLRLLSGVFFGSASVFNLSAITFFQYIAVVYPVRYYTQMSLKWAILAICLVWFMALSLALPPLIWRPSSVICDAAKPDSNNFAAEAIYMAAEWIFWFGFPGIFMVITYTRIFYIQRKRLKHLQASSSSSPVSENNQTSSLVRALREYKSARIFACIGAIFLCCWLPFFISLTHYKFASGETSPIIFQITLYVMYSNSFMNPIIIFFFNVTMRRALKRLCGRLHFRRRKVYAFNSNNNQVQNAGSFQMKDSVLI